MDEMLKASGLVPVVVLASEEQAVPTGRALMAGGIDLIEVTFRSAAASGGIRRLTAELPELLVGAGTVLDEATAKEAIDAGAKFVVSPGFNLAVVEYCQSRGIPVFPGVANPTQVEQALASGLSAVKFFPAESLGGVAMIKSLAAVYPQVGFIPTGGVNVGNVGEYLRCPAVLACGGSWFVKPDWVATGQYEKISQTAREALRACCDYALEHVGINGAGEEDARQKAELLQRMLQLPIRGSTNLFVGDLIEVLPHPSFGKAGHIGFAVNRLEVARRLLQREGFHFSSDGEIYQNGRIKVAYLTEEVGGMALHLFQR